MKLQIQEFLFSYFFPLFLGETVSTLNKSLTTLRPLLVIDPQTLKNWTRQEGGFISRASRDTE